jgi:cytoskeletal protein RodZ
MFPLDSNVLLVILIVVALFAYVFILRKLRPEMVPLKHISKESSNRANNKSAKERKNSYKTTQENPSSRTELSCMHEFGYLGTLPKNSKIPDECLGCSRIVKCLAEGRSRD